MDFVVGTLVTTFVIAPLWILGVIAVTIAAKRRGAKSAFGWCVVAILLSPVVAAVLLILIQPYVFRPTAVFCGIPYVIDERGRIEAAYPGIVVRFQSKGQFVAATQGETWSVKGGPQAEPSPLDNAAQRAA